MQRSSCSQFARATNTRSSIFAKQPTKHYSYQSTGICPHSELMLSTVLNSSTWLSGHSHLNHQAGDKKKAAAGPHVADWTFRRRLSTHQLCARLTLEAHKSSWTKQASASNGHVHT